LECPCPGTCGEESLRVKVSQQKQPNKKSLVYKKRLAYGCALFAAENR